MQHDAGWDLAALRRSMRLLGAHSTHFSNVQSTARALRLIWDMLQRRNIPAELFQLPGMMPLIVAGRGPVLVNTYLDDTSALDGLHRGDPPIVTNDSMIGQGTIRKAGLLAVVGALLSSPDVARHATLTIEADRHAGSAALEAWLHASPRPFAAGLYEVADLPVPAPALYSAATGVVELNITVQPDVGAMEHFYGGVLPDPGHQLVEAVSALKSRDAEVLVPGFYDHVVAPDPAGMAALNSVASSVGAWISRTVGPSEELLNASHLTLGVFCAPALLVRELAMAETGPYLSQTARATIEMRVMPGQDVYALIAAIRAFITARLPTATVEPLLVRKPAIGWRGPMPSLNAMTLPISPGNSPAGLIESTGIPTMGFATVSRDPSESQESVEFARIMDGSNLVSTLIFNLAHQHRALSW